MIFEKIAQAQSFEQVQKILIDTHVLLGGRDRPDAKELSSTISMIIGQMVMRPTFEHDFLILLQKLDPYLQSQSRFQRADMAESIFNTTAVCAPDKYAFVVNSWQAAAASTFVKEEQNSLIELLDRGLDVSTVVALTNQLAPTHPQLWPNLKKTILRAQNKHNNRLSFLIEGNQLLSEDVADVFVMAINNGRISKISPSDARILKTLIATHNVSLEEFLDQLTAITDPHCVAHKFIKFVRDGAVDSTTHDQASVFESVIHVFGMEYSPKYTPTLCCFKQYYTTHYKPQSIVQEWLEKMPYEAAVYEGRLNKSDIPKKKIM